MDIGFHDHQHVRAPNDGTVARHEQDVSRRGTTRGEVVASELLNT